MFFSAKVLGLSAEWGVRVGGWDLPPHPRPLEQRKARVTGWRQSWKTSLHQLGELGAKLRQVLGRGQSVTLSQEEGAGQASARGQDRHGAVY